MGTTKVIRAIWLIATLLWASHVIANGGPMPAYERVAEWTVESRKNYTDPFNEVDVDVVFAQGKQTWRVPTFWRGGSRWTVRFAPPTPGIYHYRLESTDPKNPDLNGHDGEVAITPYLGANELLRRGAIRVSASKRYFEQSDGTPFFWLGDTWWSDLSDRITFEGFKELAADRKAKGFTVIQIVAGLIPSNEELAPSDPGFCNEGGCAWDAQFQQINPAYFDAADRRISYLVEQGFVPAIVGGWRRVLGQMGPEKLKKHWRYLIARYGAYPVLWIVGGEVFDPPIDTLSDEYKKELLVEKDMTVEGYRLGEWTSVTRYVRETDPYHHPMTVHEAPPPYDTAIRDEALTDFDLFQPGHEGWASISTEIAQLDKHYARTTVVKPLVVGEIGYEGHFGEHDATFQRAAFWLAMLNGAAGFTYGTIETAEAYSTDKPAQRIKWSLRTWQEAMHRPGSTQVGLGANLLRQFHWWRLAPHPEWVVPRGTTLLEPTSQISGFDIDLLDALQRSNPPANEQLPAGEWSARDGNFRLPYAAGNPGVLRVVYVPYWGSADRPKTIPTVLSLENGVRYHAYYWDPASGTKFDLGMIARPPPGAVMFQNRGEVSTTWTHYSAGNGRILKLAGAIHEMDCVLAAKEKDADADVGLVVRGRDAYDYIAAIYSPREQVLYIEETESGIDGPKLGVTATPGLGRNVLLTTEVRDGAAMLSITDGVHRFSTPIVDVRLSGSTQIGLIANAESAFTKVDHFEVRKSPDLPKDEYLQRRLYDQSGSFRGDLNVPDTTDMERSGVTADKDDWRKKLILLDGYRPPRLPFPQDWVLVLAAE